MTSASLRAKVHPTEDPATIDKAIRSLFPDAKLCYEDFHISGTASSCDRFAEIIRNHRIRDAARGAMFRGVDCGVARFFVSKQAATVGKVSFTDGSTVLGDIEITIESEDIESAIDEIAPSTKGEQQNAADGSDGGTSHRFNDVDGKQRTPEQRWMHRGGGKS